MKHITSLLFTTLLFTIYLVGEDYKAEQIIEGISHDQFKTELAKQAFKLVDSSDTYWQYKLEKTNFEYTGQINGNDENNIAVIEGYLLNFGAENQTNNLAAPFFRYLGTLPFGTESEEGKEIFKWINTNTGKDATISKNGIKLTLFAKAARSRVLRIEKSVK